MKSSGLSQQLPFRIPPKLKRCLAQDWRKGALRILDRIIGSDYGLFRADPAILEYRQAALLFKIDLLLEWGNYSEALAWLCLETEINEDNVFAQALKERLKRKLHFDEPRRSEGDASGLPAARIAGGAVSWAGVAGMRELKLTLEKDIILPLLEPAIYRRYKVPIPNGILFYGPPGCGKTFIARMLAGILGYHFMELKPSDLASIYVHGTQGKIGDTFREAAEKHPALLFFDEIDAFIPSRASGVSHHYGSESNEFLAQMNECAKRGILVIGATNYLNRVDVAARRPGRFDKKIYIGPPDLEARIEAVNLYMKGRPQAKINCFTLLANIADHNLLVNQELYSYADLEAVVNEAAREALQAGKLIAEDHLLEAFGRIPPSITQQMVDDMSKE